MIPPEVRPKVLESLILISNHRAGLAVHLQQVHKETLERIENTLPGREDPNIEIFGTEGVPADAMLLHQQDVMSRFKEQEAAQRQAPGGVTNDVPPAKKVKVESKEELKARLAAHKAKKAAQAAAAANGTAVSTVSRPVRVRL